ncbi:hypothetical protein GCM10017653_01670 [Ancylobacter defluvii]|uniref:Uncharacterized protein n=1 Tax=Ancylobacter defluvii TaxID=1282440 RepID=A0A9W6JTC0_9HYPH|nr:hypothetical protein GCM10017653_01670 [Ancylobacter defluvii]
MPADVERHDVDMPTGEYDTLRPWRRLGIDDLSQGQLRRISAHLKDPGVTRIGWQSGQNGLKPAPFM